MLALSIRQPWAWLIIRPDVTDPVDRRALYAAGEIKDIENRDWATKLRGRFIVHASKTIDHEGIAYVREAMPQIVLPTTFDLGGIVGVARMVNCVRSSDSQWFFGPFGFVLQDAEPLPFVPIRGMPGFFDIRLPAPVAQLQEAHS